MPRCTSECSRAVARCGWQSAAGGAAGADERCRGAAHITSSPFHWSEHSKHLISVNSSSGNACQVAGARIIGASCMLPPADGASPCAALPPCLSSASERLAATRPHAAASQQQGALLWPTSVSPRPNPSHGGQACPNPALGHPARRPAEPCAGAGGQGGWVRRRRLPLLSPAVASSLVRSATFPHGSSSLPPQLLR